jgi:ABC-2 type transport system ATP-binding protein
MLELYDVSVVLGGKRILDGVNLSVGATESVGLLGPSGSGKSTLMRAVVGVQVVRSGTVTVLGEPAGSPALRHAVGYLTQSPSVYPDLTVQENVRYFSSLYFRGSRSRGAAAEAIEAVGLAGTEHQLVGSLSGGQHSRASLACALVGDPQLLVLDEPTVGQDPVLREELWARFHQLAERGVTVLVSSHVMDEANRCERLQLIREGAIIADATPDQVREHAGTTDLDQAFLTLVRRHEGSPR